MKYLSSMGLALLLSACGIGGQWMNGNPSAGRNIKAYIEYWVKDGVTNDERFRNWVACGGNKDGSFSWKEVERISGESNEQSAKRQDTNHQYCMIRAGYRYTGNCSSKYMKSQPLCGAP